MSSCEAEHKQCREHFKYESVQKLPTRLLKIEGQNGGVTRVRLVDTSDCEGTYACLSYCWGSNGQESMTTTANLDKYRHKIPWQELPSTISDAIKLCYRLGFQYLWVDSLCIVQNDEQDWLREASNMAGVYSKSALTLAVPLCDDASESFLQKRLLNTKQWSDGHYGCARVPFTDLSTGDKREMYLWDNNFFKGSRFLDNGWYDIRSFLDQTSGKWFSRAWTFQEWFLSPRVLHIHTMTVWDCFQSYGNELERRFLRQQHTSDSREQFDDFSWTYIVHGFTARQITQEKDRLPALAGLAERFRAETGSTYLAGLWVEDLPKGLLWVRYPQTSAMNRPLTYRAPTWSWASLEGEVSLDSTIYCSEEALPTSEILGYYCQYDPPETLATVTDGWIDVEGSMSIVSGWTLREDDSWVPEIRLFTDDQVEGTPIRQCWVATLDLGQSIEEEISSSEVCLLELLAEEAKDGPRIIPVSYALVLKSVQRHGMGQDCFQRLGVAHSVSLTFSSSRSLTERWARRKIRLI